MKTYELKYGCNPNQKPAKIYMKNDGELPIEILNGSPGYINLLDAFNSWQLVKEIKEATGLVAATSFKHVSPTSAAVGYKLDENLKKACFVQDIENLDESPLACAYARARGTDRMSSFGDWIALSDKCDLTCAKVIQREVSDGIIAPDYDDDALELLRRKKKGKYNIIKINPYYIPEQVETKEVFGITFSQNRNNVTVNKSDFKNIVTKKKTMTDSAETDLIIAMITLKYTQSNSVCYAYGGQTIGVGAGQQSRIHCTRLAGEKADKWLLRQSDKVLNLPFKEDVSRAERDNAIDIYLSQDQEDLIGEAKWTRLFSNKPEAFTLEERQEYLSKISGVSLASDAFFPFGDNIIRASKSGVSFVVQPGGSVRDDNVIYEADRFNMVMAMTGIRLFHH